MEGGRDSGAGPGEHGSRGRSSRRKGSRSGRRSRSSSQQARSTLRALLLDSDQSDGTPGRDGGGAAGTRVDPPTADVGVTADGGLEGAAALRHFPAGAAVMQAASDAPGMGLLSDTVGAMRMPPPRVSAASLVSFVAATPAGSSPSDGDGDGEGIPATPTEELNLGAFPAAAEGVVAAALSQLEPLRGDSAQLAKHAQAATAAPLTEALLQQQQQRQLESGQHAGDDLLARLLASSSEDDQQAQAEGAGPEAQGAAEEHVATHPHRLTKVPLAACEDELPHPGIVRAAMGPAGQPLERLSSAQLHATGAAGAFGGTAAAVSVQAPWTAGDGAFGLEARPAGGSGSPAMQRRGGAVSRGGALYEPLHMQPSRISPQTGRPPAAPGSGRGPGSTSASKQDRTADGSAGGGSSKRTSGSGFTGSANGAASVYTSRAKLSLASKLLAYSGNPPVSPLGVEVPSRVSSVAVPQLHFVPSAGLAPAACAAGPSVAANGAHDAHPGGGASGGTTASHASAAHQPAALAAPTASDGAAVHANNALPGAAVPVMAAASTATPSLGWGQHTPACQPVKGPRAAAAAVAVASSGAPSSANSTPFDDEMLAALDSLERRVNAVSEHVGVGVTGSAAATAYGLDKAGGPSSYGGGGYVTTALELLEREQGRAAQHQQQYGQQLEQEPAWGGFPKLDQQGPPAWQQQYAHHQAQPQHQVQQPQQPGDVGSLQEQQVAQPQPNVVSQPSHHASTAAPCPASRARQERSAAWPGGAISEPGVPASAAEGGTPELPLQKAHAQLQGRRGDASAAGTMAQQAGSTGPTPEMESGGLFAALDALEERHRLAEAEAAAAAEAAAPGGNGLQGQERPAAAVGKADQPQLASIAVPASRRVNGESPLPVKQLAFTPLHGRRDQQQEAQLAAPRPSAPPPGYNPYLPPQLPCQGQAHADAEPQPERQQQPRAPGAVPPPLPLPPPQQQAQAPSHAHQVGSGQSLGPHTCQEAAMRLPAAARPGGPLAQGLGHTGASAIGLPPRPPSAQANRAVPQQLQQQRVQEPFQHVQQPPAFASGPPPPQSLQGQPPPQEQPSGQQAAMQNQQNHQTRPQQAMQQLPQQPANPRVHPNAQPQHLMQQEQPQHHVAGNHPGQALSGGVAGQPLPDRQAHLHLAPERKPINAAITPVAAHGVPPPQSGARPAGAPIGVAAATGPGAPELPFGARCMQAPELGPGAAGHVVVAAEPAAPPAVQPAATFAAQPAAQPVAEIGDGSDDSDDEDAEAYAAPMTQRAVVEGQMRQRRRSTAPDSHRPHGRAGGSQVGSGNLAASLAAAAASGAGSVAAGGTPLARGDGAGTVSTPGKRSPVPGPGGNADEPGLEPEAAPGAGGTPSAQQQPAPPRQLEAYLPEPLCQAYYDRSSRQFELYEWQAECLCQLGVLMGRNLVYCAPTSGGKSMVAEMLGIRRLLTTGKPFMLVLPFVALCAEKADALQALLAPINRTVNSAYGGQTSGKIIQPGVGAIVATIEKANMLVNAMLEEETLGELSAVVVDELHMVGEEERGYLLELLLTKLRFATSASATANSALTSPGGGGGGGPGGMTEAEEPPFDWTAVGPAYQRDGLQVIGMSATMPNVDVVARWLDAALYITDFRPVHLQEYVKVGRRIMDSSGALVRELAPDKGWEDRDADHVALLTQETVREGHSVLIFCASKFWCEKVAEHVARLVTIAQRDPPPIAAAAAAAAGKDPADGGVSPAGVRNARDTYVQELRRLSGGDPTLPDLVARGVAYHHAGLSNEERDLIEAAYKAGAISVLTATSTLAAGVNLPARRVIFRHTYIGKQDNPIDATKYRQMSGRAGRAGIDTAGESFIICEKNRPVAPLLALMQQKANPIASCLTEARKGMKRAVLEVVASGAVSSGTDVKRFIACTLIHAQHGFGTVAKATIAALHWLKDNGFIRVDEATLNWGPTPFGKATLASSMPPEEALVVRADLERARMSLVLATDLHVTYLVTPIKEDLRVDWEIYFHWFEKLSKVDARVAELVGVVPGYLVKLRQGHRGARGGGAGGGGGAVGTAASADSEKERIARRFFAAMVLNDLIQEIPLKEVAEKYGLGKEKGPLEGLQERAGRFAAMVAAFCERLGWSDMEVIIAKFQSRVWYGVRPEVVALTEIPYVKGHRARLLFKAGLRTPEAVAACEFDRLLEILTAGGGAKNPEQEEQQRKTERRAARMILQGAKDLVNQKVQELKQQARALRAALDPGASQEHSAPIDPSLAPPKPPAQEGSDASARRAGGSGGGGGGSTSGVDRSPGAAAAVGGKLAARAAQMAVGPTAGGPDGAAESRPGVDRHARDLPAAGEAPDRRADDASAVVPVDGVMIAARQPSDGGQEQSTTPSRPPKQPRTGRSPPDRMQVEGTAAATSTAGPGPVADVLALPAAASPGKPRPAGALPSTNATAPPGGGVAHLGPQPLSTCAAAVAAGSALVASEAAAVAASAPTAAGAPAGAQQAKRPAAAEDEAVRADEDHGAKRVRLGAGEQGQHQHSWPPNGQQQRPYPPQRQQQPQQPNLYHHQQAPQEQRQQQPGHLHQQQHPDLQQLQREHQPHQQPQPPQQQAYLHHPHNPQHVQQAPPQYVQHYPQQQQQQQQWQLRAPQTGANAGQHQALERHGGQLPEAGRAAQAGPWPGTMVGAPPEAPGAQQWPRPGDMRPPNHLPPPQAQGPPQPYGQRPPHPHQQHQQLQQPPPQPQQHQGYAHSGGSYPSGAATAGYQAAGAPQQQLQLPQQTSSYLPHAQLQHPSNAAAPPGHQQPLQQQPRPPQQPQPQQLPSIADKRKLMSPMRNAAAGAPSPGRTGRSPGGRWSGRSPSRGGAAASPRGAGRCGGDSAQQQPQQQASSRSGPSDGGIAATAAGAAAGTGAGQSGDESYLHAVQSQVPMLRVPGFTVLKSAAEVAAACEQLRRVGVWAFALDFAEGGPAAAPAAANANLQLPSVPQVALGRGVATNSVGLPQHFELDPLPAGRCGAAAAAGASGTPTFALGEAAASVTGQLEGIALCAADGCALYIPLAATVALAGVDGSAGCAAAGGPPAAVERAAREAEAVWSEVRQLLAHKESTKITFELKSQLLMARAAIQSAASAKTSSSSASADNGASALGDAGTAPGSNHHAGPAPGAFSAALAACGPATRSAEAAAAAGGSAGAAPITTGGVAGGTGEAVNAALLVPLHVADPVVDVRILLWMLNPDDPINMPRGKSGKLSLTKGLEERMKMPDVCGSTANTKALGVLNCAGVVVRQLPTRQADACRRAAMVRRIYIDKLPRLQSEGLLRPLLELEMPLVRILARMEAEGIALAPQVLKDQRGPLEARLRQLAAKAHVAAGMTFDLNSPKDVSEVLFTHLGLPPPPCAFSNQNQRHPSTKKEVLEELEESTHHPIIRLLLDYRTLHKLLTGFVETLYHTAKGQWQRQQQELERRQGPHPPGGGSGTCGAGTTGGRGTVPDVIRLCGTWLHTSTATGRLAMDEPNLQTVPRPVEYSFVASQLSQASPPGQDTPPRLPLAGGVGGGGGGGCGAEEKQLARAPAGEEGGTAEGGRSVTLHFNLRSAFVAPPGCVVLAVDYKQIELRLMAHFSGDTALCALLRNPAQDPFILLAAEWKKVPVEQVTPEVRVQAKRLAYGMLYGMGTNTLAQELGVSVAEAAELSDNFRRAIPGVDRWMREVVEAVRSCGYTTTLMGRRRYYSRINERASKDARSARAQAERQAVNTVCQGSAADLVKAAMVTLQRRLEAEGLAPHVRMVLMVHDELVFEVSEPLLPAAARLVQAVLEGEVALSVPLPVKLSAGPSWGQLQDYEPPLPPPPPAVQQQLALMPAAGK